MSTPSNLSVEASPNALMRLYYRVVLTTVAAVLVLHLAFRLVLDTGKQLGPLVLALDTVIFVLSFLGMELERPTEGRPRRYRGLFLSVLGLLLVALCFETGGLASPYFLLVILGGVFAALTLRPSQAMLVTSFLATAYTFGAWVSPSDGFLYGGLERIRSTLLTGRQMKADEVVALTVHVAFLFMGAWVSTRVSAGFRQKVSRLEVHAMRDPLTTLPNRRAFVEKVRQEIDRAERYRWPLTMLIIDLDHFKKVNDVHGHGFGDAVLGQAAQLLREAVGTIDHLARIGGEEFAVAAVGADPNHGGDLAARVLRRFRSFAWDRMKPGLLVTCSVGVSVLHPGQGEGDADTKLSWLLEQADKALYHVKGNGRDNFHVAETAGSPPPRSLARSPSA